MHVLTRLPRSVDSSATQTCRSARARWRSRPPTVVGGTEASGSSSSPYSSSRTARWPADWPGWSELGDPSRLRLYGSPTSLVQGPAAMVPHPIAATPRWRTGTRLESILHPQLLPHTRGTSHRSCSLGWRRISGSPNAPVPVANRARRRADDGGCTLDNEGRVRGRMTRADLPFGARLIAPDRELCAPTGTRTRTHGAQRKGWSVAVSWAPSVG
jgi:hypothetical protein